MSTGIKFDDAMARRVEAVYRTKDAVQRRRAVLNALQLRPGERILDIGTGPGFVAYEIAEAVGSTGSVHALDSSEPMLGLARKRCADMPWVNFSAGQATDLQLPDAGFDVAVSVQVYEYVADVDRALAEMLRVLRPGGRAAVVSSDWASMAWEATDKERRDRVLSAFEEHCAYVDLPRQLAPKLLRTGFNIEAQSVIVQFNPKYDSDTYSVQLIPIVGSFIVGRRGVTQEDAEAWMEDLRQMGDKGEYFFCLNQFLYLLTKPM